MKHLLFVCLLAFSLTSSSQGLEEKYALIPWPQSVVEMPGDFLFNRGVAIIVEQDTLRSDAAIFNQYVLDQYDMKLNVISGRKSSDGAIFLSASGPKDAPVGSYELKVSPTAITIVGTGTEGVFYGLQTLMQLLPAGRTDVYKIPCVSIKDSPRFPYRGMHLDVSRHYFPVGYIRRYIDILSKYKMNYFHWHLTDDQGWRIEIKKYPELQTVSAWRSGTLIGHYSATPAQYDTVRHGGYYTQEEIKQVVAYAAQRHVTIIPEIEMPGHATAALAAYPNLSCTGGPFQVARTWGVFQDVYCTKEETFTFLNDVLKEVCDMFPGPYIHVGGDECPKDRWKACSQCQSVIKREQLKDETELQSWFMRRVGKMLQANGKRMIGWDEILEGGLAPDATVMSWRGYQGGIEAARQGHDVIMTPTSHCYFDYYQSRNPGEPLAIGGYLPLSKVYSLEPVPAELDPKQSSHILGAQGNLWTEYILSPSHAEVAVMPRLCALAEVTWTAKDRRDYDRFTTRLFSNMKMLQFQGYSYSKAIFDVTSTISPNDGKGLTIALSTPYKQGLIRYNNSQDFPTERSAVYTEPFKVDQSFVFVAGVYEGTMLKGNVLEQIFKVNYATGKEVSLANAPDEEYSQGGGFTLVNGLTGRLPWNGADWLGFRGTPLDATVDLGAVMGINKVALDVLSDEGSWIHFPKSVEVRVSQDGKSFTSVAKLTGDQLDPSKRLVKIPVKTTARYVKIVAENAGVIPEGKPGAGNPAWLFADEIVIE